MSGVPHAARYCGANDTTNCFASRVAYENPTPRVSSYDVVVPLSRLEGAYMPDTRRIMDAVRKCLSFG